MPEFHVNWEIEVEADSPREAAEEAQRLMRDVEAMVGVFIVTDGWKPFKMRQIDLDNDDPADLQVRWPDE